MSKKNDTNAAREIIAEAEKLVSEWPEWKQRQFEKLSTGDYHTCRDRQSIGEVSKKVAAA